MALLLAVYTLPSALNLPQANPGQVAEYAPVPGNGTSAPPGGNLAGLGLGEGGSPQGGTGSGPGGGTTSTSVPTPFHCVGSPPRQTEDPLSPPCVPYFKGDNGGSTWVGVTGRQVNVVFRFVALDNGGTCYYGSTQTNNCGPPTGYYDMENQADVNQFVYFRYLHDWDVYFNKYYQTYGRHVHFWAYNYGDTTSVAANGYGSNNAAADGSDNWSHVYSGVAHPFAALDESGLFSESYTTQLASHGVLDFGGFGFTQKLASEYPGLYWSYPPPLDRLAEEYASFVCTRVVQPGRVTFSGNGNLGAPRKYGLLLTDDQEDPALQNVQKEAVRDMQSECGFQAADTEYFHYVGLQTAGQRSGWGTTNVAGMQTKGVTTVIWPGGVESEDMQAANSQKWFPEWVLMGDGDLDGYQFGEYEPTAEITHAWVESPQPLINTDGYPTEPACYDAITATDPSIPRSKVADISWACAFYDDIRQLFTGIQLSGPHLTPQNMDQGFHAIPPKPSTTPTQPSCFYLPGDYTCVKDAEMMWWDPTASAGSGSQPGYYRMWEGGRRFLPGQWPAGDVNQGKQPDDVINLYTGPISINARND